jgi:hypothetical protein
VRDNIVQLTRVIRGAHIEFEERIIEPDANWLTPGLEERPKRFLDMQPGQKFRLSDEAPIDRVTGLRDASIYELVRFRQSDTYRSNLGRCTLVCALGSILYYGREQWFAWLENGKLVVKPARDISRLKPLRLELAFPTRPRS